jgi:hypothetical protein
VTQLLKRTRPGLLFSERAKLLPFAEFSSTVIEAEWA